jgi:hypothetical protein
MRAKLHPRRSRPHTTWPDAAPEVSGGELFNLTYILGHQLQPEVARDALLSIHDGLSLELYAVIGHISPMALYRLMCALGQQSLVCC